MLRAGPRLRQPGSGRWGSLKVVWGTGARETQAVGTMPSPARCKERKERGTPVRMCGRLDPPPDSSWNVAITPLCRVRKERGTASRMSGRVGHPPFIRVHWCTNWIRAGKTKRCEKGLREDHKRTSLQRQSRTTSRRAGSSGLKMSIGFCSPGNVRPWWRWWRGLPATAIAVKTPTISTASGGCGRSMGEFAFSDK